MCLHSCSHAVNVVWPRNCGNLNLPVAITGAADGRGQTGQSKYAGDCTCDSRRGRLCAGSVDACDFSITGLLTAGGIGAA